MPTLKKKKKSREGEKERNKEKKENLCLMEILKIASVKIIYPYVIFKIWKVIKNFVLYEFCIGHNNFKAATVAELAKAHSF